MRHTGLAVGTYVLVGLLLLPGCGGRGHGASAVPSGPAGAMQMPASVSPGSIKPPPMVQSPIQPPSAMTSIRQPRSDIQTLGWTQLPGGGIYVTASPDGSIWVLSSIGSGPDRSIWHYVNGSWTNIPGAAMRMAVAPNNTLWVVNSGGGIYAYNGSWTGIAGGASDITVGTDGSVYVISNQGGGPYGRGIWRYAGGSWTQMPGAAVRIAASWDTGTYPGNIAPGGFWVTNAVNGIFYYNPATGFGQVPGGAGQVAPTKSGGLFALGYITNPDGSSPIYYNNLATGSWTQEPGAATSIATNATNVYVTGAGGGIYSAPIAIVGPPTTGVAYMTAAGAGSFQGIMSANSQFALIAAVSQSELTNISAANPQPDYDTLTFKVGTSASTFAVGRAPQFLKQFVSVAELVGRPAPSGPSLRYATDAVDRTDAERRVEKLLQHAQHMNFAASTRRSSSLPTGLGSTHSFYVEKHDLGSTGSPTFTLLPTTLSAVTAHGNIWVDNSLSFSSSSLQTIANDFENAYLSDSQHFGTPEWTSSAPGASAAATPCDSNGSQISGAQPAPVFIPPPNGHHNVVVLNTQNLGNGVGGYFNGNNYFTAGFANCFRYPSNEASLIFVGYNTGIDANYELYEDLVRGTAHEFQHALNFVHHVVLSNTPRNDDRWINEGLSMLSQDFAANRLFGVPIDVGDAAQRARDFLDAAPLYSLTGFTGYDPATQLWHYNCGTCYGDVYLFQRYLYDRFGGDSYLHAMEGQATSFAEIQAATGHDPKALISDYGVALLASGLFTGIPREFSFTGFNPYGTYTDQFGNQTTFGGPGGYQQAPGTSQTYTVGNGTFGYFFVDNAGHTGAGVTVTDNGGIFNLAPAVAQK